MHQETSQRDIEPLLPLDYPDPDVIRVGDTYYMVSTTMHFMPGCVILRSYNLVDWEIVTYVYDELEHTDAECLESGQNAYGQGMWAATLRYHEGTYYICFVANDTHKTYLYRSQDILGPWTRNEIRGFYHDSSLIFDGGKAYLAYGNSQIYITELNDDLTGPKEGGLHKLVVTDSHDVRLGYEGTHWYKIGERYYLFFIHWKKDKDARRSQVCYVSDHLEGPYTGRDVYDTDGGYHGQGIAQGGIVDTPTGEWYSILFQDRGAVGRLPVLVPVRWEDDFPVFGAPRENAGICSPRDNRPGYNYAPLYGDDDFTTLKPYWQWNHIPDPERWSLTTSKDGATGELHIWADTMCVNVTQARCTLTQRLLYPTCEATVTVDGSGLGCGDLAGVCLLQSDYASVGITRERDGYALVQIIRPGETVGDMNPPDDTTKGIQVARMMLQTPIVRIRLRADFTDMRDIADFDIEVDGTWRHFGETLPLHFKLDHFCGVRIGLCCYTPEPSGGYGAFREFHFIESFL